jgi:hypothetical protein
VESKVPVVNTSHSYSRSDSLINWTASEFLCVIAAPTLRLQSPWRAMQVLGIEHNATQTVPGRHRQYLCLGASRGSGARRYFGGENC